MSSHNERVTPAQFELAEPEPTVVSDARPTRPQWILPVLGTLIVVALLVVFWLPGRVQPPDPAAADTPVDSVATRPATQPRPEAAEESTPWMDAQAAKLRKAAQDTLAELLDIQYELEERGVERWAAEAYANARSSAEQGDELYKSRDFTGAQTAYDQALQQLTELLTAIPDVMDGQLGAARSAIEQLDSQAATDAMDLAVVLEPEHADIPGLLNRVSQIEALQELTEHAQASEQQGDLAAAETALGEAAQLDPQHESIAAEFARVSDAHLEQQFRSAMSRGYGALDEGQYKTARTAFNAASALRAGSREAADALQELHTAETDYQLNNLQNKAARLEAQEQWQEAVDAYQQAAAIDGNLLFVKSGLKKAQQRAQVDKKFSEAIAQPDRLTDVAVAESMADLLAQAREVSPQGRKLNEQISQLESLLAKANTPIAVTLQSDLETEVIVYKVSRLGRFERTDLKLRPGTYTAVGTRIGYRDVRVKFTLSHNSPTPAVVIACTEQI